MFAGARIFILISLVGLLATFRVSDKAKDRIILSLILYLPDAFLFNYWVETAAADYWKPHSRLSVFAWRFAGAFLSKPQYLALAPINSWIGRKPMSAHEGDDWGCDLKMTLRSAAFFVAIVPRILNFGENHWAIPWPASLFFTTGSAYPERVFFPWL